MIINHNLSAIFAQRQLKFNNWNVDKDIERLSSGMRINRSGDDASGLAVSEKMRTQIRGLRQAERNAEDGISFIQTTEGYLQESQDLLQRVRELAIQASNGIYTTEDRQLLQVEVSQLQDEMKRVARDGEFNTMRMLTGRFARQNADDTQNPGAMWFHIGANMDQRIPAFIGDMTPQALKVNTMSVSSPNQSNSAVGIIDVALNTISKQRADLGAYQNRLEYTARGLMVAYENTQASESRIRDTDMAEQMVSFTKNQILQQSGTAMLAQANLKPQSVLALLR
jgi:flagellin